MQNDAGNCNLFKWTIFSCVDDWLSSEEGQEGVSQKYVMLVCLFCVFWGLMLNISESTST
jgi:hypothetical protein